MQPEMPSTQKTVFFKTDDFGFYDIRRGHATLARQTPDEVYSGTLSSPRRLPYPAEESA